MQPKRCKQQRVVHEETQPCRNVNSHDSASEPIEPVNIRPGFYRLPNPRIVPFFSNCIDSENQCSAQGNPCSPQNDPALPVRFHQGDDAQQATSDWRRINSSSPASSRTSTSDFALAPLDINDHYPIEDDHYCSLSPDRSIRENPTFPAADRIQVGLPYLDSFIEALQAQETWSGLTY
jgi:hypothetical protein